MDGKEFFELLRDEKWHEMLSYLTSTNIDESQKKATLMWQTEDDMKLKFTGKVKSEEAEPGSSILIAILLYICASFESYDEFVDQRNPLLEVFHKILSLFESDPELLMLQTKSGYNILHYAVEIGNERFISSITKSLDEDGWKKLVTMKCDAGDSPLHVACWCGKIKHVKTLVHHGGHQLLMMQNNSKQSCLHEACMNKMNHELIQFLSDKGGDRLVKMKDCEGRTAYDYALENLYIESNEWTDRNFARIIKVIGRANVSNSLHGLLSINLPTAGKKRLQQACSFLQNVLEGIADTSENQSLKRKNSKLKKEVKQLQSTNAKLEKELTNSEKLHNKTTTGADSNQSALKKENHELKKTVRHLQSTNARLQKELTDSSKHLATADSQFLKGKIDKLNIEVVQLKMTKESLQKKLKDSQKYDGTMTAVSQSLKRKNDELNKEIQQLRSINEQIQTKLTTETVNTQSLKRKNDELNEKVQHLQSTNQSLKLQSSDSEKHSATAPTDSQSLEKENDELKQEIVSFKARLDMLDSAPGSKKNKHRSALLTQKMITMDSSDDEEALQDCPQESYSSSSSSRKRARFVSPSNQRRLSHKEHREESFNSNDDLKLELRRCLRLLQNEKKSHSETLKKLQMEKLDHNETLEKWESLL